MQARPDDDRRTARGSTNEKAAPANVWSRLRHALLPASEAATNVSDLLLPLEEEPNGGDAAHVMSVAQVLWTAVLLPESGPDRPHLPSVDYHDRPAHSHAR